MNPEKFHPDMEEEFDDSPFADTNNQRKAYQKNLAEQRSNLDQEQINAEGRAILEALNENPLEKVKTKVRKDKAEADKKHEEFESKLKKMTDEERKAYWLNHKRKNRSK